MPPLDSQILGLSRLRALGVSVLGGGAAAGAADEPAFEQIFSFQESTYGRK